MKKLSKEITKNLLKGHSCLDCEINLYSQGTNFRKIKRAIKSSRCKATLGKTKVGYIFQRPSNNICDWYQRNWKW